MGAVRLWWAGLYLHIQGWFPSRGYWSVHSHHMWHDEPNYTQVRCKSESDIAISRWSCWYCDGLPQIYWSMSNTTLFYQTSSSFQHTRHNLVYCCCIVIFVLILVSSPFVLFSHHVYFFLCCISTPHILLSVWLIAVLHVLPFPSSFYCLYVNRLGEQSVSP